jgi:hypothetical protein
MRSSHLAQADTRTLNQRSGEPRNGVRQLPISRPRATSDPPRVRTMHRARFARRAARNRQSTIRVGRICGSWSRSRRLHLPADGEPEVEGIYWLRAVTDRSALASYEYGAAALDPWSADAEPDAGGHRAANDPLYDHLARSLQGNSVLGRCIRGASRWLARGPSTNVV